MSGIAGIVRFDGAPVETGLVERMTAAMTYRGPGGINHWSHGEVAFGHCMLHTTPESLVEKQPLLNEDGSVILVMDGRVDNWEGLRRELVARGAHLRTSADAELVLRAYEEWGADCVDHIDGDFAIVIWDAINREAFCARDRMGNKPLCYYYDGKSLVFASEVQAILKVPWIPQVPNEGVLAEYLSNEWYSHEETFWTGVSRLMSGHRMRLTDSSRDQSRYWEPDLAAVLPRMHDDDLVSYYQDLLAEQVRRMSRSHRTVAFEVSGGLDSSALFACADSLHKRNLLPAPGVSGYALAFHEDQEANEIEFFRAVARHIGCDIQEVAPSIVGLEWYRSAAAHYREFPGYPNGVMSIGLRERVCGAGTHVLITGMGGDEWMGMPARGAYYAEELALGEWRNVLRSLDEDRRILGLPRALWWLMRYGVAPLLPADIKVILRGRSRDSERQVTWLSEHFQAILKQRREKFSVQATLKFHRRGQQAQHQMLHWAYDVIARESEERMSARIGIELRSPFNSRAIVEFAFSTPERYRSRALTTKWLHRRAVKDLLPAKVVERTSKADFMGAFRQALHATSTQEWDELFRRRAAWVQPGEFSRLLDRLRRGHGAGKTEWLIWSLVGSDLLANGVPAQVPW